MKIRWSKVRCWLQGPTPATSAPPHSANPSWVAGCMPKGTLSLCSSSFPRAHTCRGPSAARAEVCCLPSSANKLLTMPQPGLLFGAIWTFMDWVVPPHQGQQYPYLPVIHGWGRSRHYLLTSLNSPEERAGGCKTSLPALKLCSSRPPRGEQAQHGSSSATHPDPAKACLLNRERLHRHCAMPPAECSSLLLEQFSGNAARQKSIKKDSTEKEAQHLHCFVSPPSHSGGFCFLSNC